MSTFLKGWLVISQIEFIITVHLLLLNIILKTFNIVLCIIQT